MEDYLIEEILFRLPVKPLARFKCLSTKWNHFISFNLYFRKNYRNIGGCPLMLGVFQNITFSPYLNFDDQLRFLPTSDEGKLLMLLNKKKDDSITPWFDESLSFLGEDHTNLYKGASSNGFLLCSQSFPREPDVICNPITKGCLFLPKPSIMYGNLKKQIVMAFSCKENFNQYKVVRALTVGNYIVFEIFDDCSSLWRQFPFAGICYFTGVYDFSWGRNNHGVISEKSGISYWPIDTRREFEFNSILIFDHEYSGKLEMIQLPGEVRKGKIMEGKYEGQCGGHFFGQSSELLLYALHSHQAIHMWVLDEDTKTWSSMEYNVENSSEHFVRIHVIHPLDPRLLLMELENGNTVWFNVESKMMELVLEKLELHQEFLPYTCPNWPPSFLLFK